MYQQRNGRQLMMIGGGVIIVVLLAAFFLTRGSGSKTPTAVPESQVVVALQSVPQGTTFAAGQPLTTYFGVEKMPKASIPFGAYTNVNQIQKLVQSSGCQPTKAPGCRGQVTVTQTIYQSLPVLGAMFSTLGQYRVAAGPAFQIPYGYVAIGVNFSAINSVLGSINPGDDIDLMASYTAGEGNATSKSVPTQTQYVMNDLRVIGINGPPPAPPTTTGSGSSTTSGAPAAAAATGGQLLLLVRFQQALIIQHLKDFAGSWSMSAVLRSSKETDIPHFKTLPVTARWFFTKQPNHFSFTNPY